MMWEERDINDSELYIPRSKPLVKKPKPLSLSDTEPLRLRHSQNDGETTRFQKKDNGEYFVFDEDPRWNDSVAELKEAVPEMPGSIQRPLKSAAVDAAVVSKRVNTGKKVKEAQNRLSKRKEMPFLYVGVIVLCTAILAVIGVMMMPQLAGYFWKDMDNFAFINGEMLRYNKSVAQTYRQYREYMRQDVIYPGIFVEGIHVGGLTREEAKQALSSNAEAVEGLYSVTVSIGNRNWLIDGSNVPAARDLGSIVERAYAIGRTNTTEILGTKQTPFRERVITAMALRESGVNLVMSATFDQNALRAVVGEIASYVNRAPKEAEIESFDFNTRTFTFSDEQVGVVLNEEELYGEIAGRLHSRETGATINVMPTLIQPDVTKSQLAQSFRMISAYTTGTTSEKNRNHNIDLASKAINGTVLLPGEVFSFNQTTGQRTIDKGYQEAGAISGGQSIEEIGGGICQVSSTLFNAVVRANLEVVSRSPHAWPSTYVNKGEDATVNWPNLDFQFKNNTNSPVFVITYYKDRKCSAEIWGLTLGENVYIDLYSEVVKTTNPPSDVNYVNNPSLPYGSSQEKIKARTGYVVDTYQVWYQGDKEIKREKLQTTTYRAYQRVVEYN